MESLTEPSAPKYTSYSQLTTYAECGEKYRLTRMNKHVEMPAWWNAGGSAVHDATETIDKWWWDSGEPDWLANNVNDEMITDQFIIAFDKEVEKMGEHKDEARASRGQKHEWWMEHGPGMVRHYYDWLLAIGWKLWSGATDPDNPPVEYMIDTKLDPSTEDSRVLCYIDRIFETPSGSLVVADLKTGARKPSSPLQLGVYRAGLLAATGVDVTLGCYLMCRKPMADQPTTEYLMGLDNYSPTHINKYVQNLRRGIEAEVFMPNRNSFCKTCGVRQYCWAANPQGEK